MAASPASDPATGQADAGDTTVDELLGGAVRLMQPRHGYRVCMDTVMLAAAVPAGPADRVLEAGTGAGGAALCLARRVGGAEVVGVEVQRAMVDLARRNVDLNDLAGRMSIVRASVTSRPAALGTEQFDHVLANPPYLEAGRAVRPPSVSKGRALMDTDARLADWVDFCLDMLRAKGTVTFIHRADRVDELVALLFGRVGEIALCPLWPRLGRPAKRVIVQGRKGAGGVCTVLPGIALHGPDGGYTSEAEAILRDAGPIVLRRAQRCAGAQSH